MPALATIPQPINNQSLLVMGINSNVENSFRNYVLESKVYVQNIVKNFSYYFKL